MSQTENGQAQTPEEIRQQAAFDAMQAAFLAPHARLDNIVDEARRIFANRRISDRRIADRRQS